MKTTIKKRIEEINNGIVPEGYEKTSFGIFPCDWIKVSLGEVSAKKGEYGLNAPACEYEEGLPKYLRITDIDDQGRYIDNKACVNDADSHKYVLNKGDIVFARTGASVGKNYTYDEKDGILVYAGFLIKFSIKPQYNANLICSNCRTKKYNNWVAKMCARSGQPGINAEEYATYSFIIPKSAQEQSRIAEILMQWDKAIELQEKLIEAYQKSKKYYLNKMFPKKVSNIPEIRFPGFTAPWEQRKLGDIVSRFATGLNPRDNFTLNNGGRNYYVTIKNFTHGNLVLDDNCDKIDDDALALIQARSDLCIGDILFSSIGRVGDCYLIENKPINWNINESVFVLRPVKDAVDPLYLMHTIHSERVLSVILSCVTGSTFKSIKMAQLKETNIPYPSIAEQERIGRLITTIDNLITLHQQKRDKLLKQRQAMQQYLLTGIVRV